MLIWVDWDDKRGLGRGCIRCWYYCLPQVTKFTTSTFGRHIFCIGIDGSLEDSDGIVGGIFLDWLGYVG